MSCNFSQKCRIHPAAQSEICEQQWITGFHDELSLCVKCCRMVDSVPRWQLSLSGPIQSDHLLIAVCDDTAFGAGKILSTFLESRSWIWKIIIIAELWIHLLCKCLFVKKKRIYYARQ